MKFTSPLKFTQLVSKQNFQRRLFTGFTFAFAPDRLDEAKNRILDFLSDLSSEMSQGSCSEVYQCNVQLFPLTNL